MAEGIGTVKRIPGKDLATVISRSLAKDYYTAIVELVSNSYDADAENVWININTLDDVIVMEDDGIGMDEKGIEDFYRMGDSEKKNYPITAKGRKKIGQFGIATLLLEYLAGSYILETWKNNSKIIVKEDFGKRQNATDTIPYSIMESYGKKNGTKIALRGLNFKDKTFSLKRLEKILTWEMPLSNDFLIHVNNEVLCREKISPTTQYYFESDLPHAGRVTGVLNYFRQGTSNKGIYIKVHGRSVGSKDYFDLGRVSRALHGKVLGEINADGLHNHIGFDRSRFQYDNPAVAEVIKEVYDQLKQIKADISEIKKNEEIIYAKKIIPAALKSTDRIAEKISLSSLEKLAKKTDKELNKLIEKGVKITFKDNVEQEEIIGNYNGKLKFSLADKPSSEGMAIFDSSDNTVYINANHPFFHLTRNKKKEYNLLLQFLFGASNAIGRKLTEEYQFTKSGFHKFKANEILEKRDKFLFDLSKKSFSSYSNLVSLLKANLNLPDRITNLNPNRVYKIDELRETTGMSLLTSRKLIEADALKSRTENDLFLGKDITDALNQIRGCVPAYLIVREYFENDRNVKRQRIEQIEKKVELQIDAYSSQIDYAKNIGVTKPFYFIEEEQKQKFLTLYKTGLLRLKKYGPNILPQELATKKGVMGPIYVNLYEAKVSLGISLNGVLELFDKALNIGYTIESSKKNGVDVYKLADLERINKTYQEKR